MELSSDTFAWLISQAARIRSAHGEVIGVPALVEPTSEYFPDAFTKDAESVDRLLSRFVSYTPLDDELPIRLGFEEDQKNVQAGGCGSTACGKGGEAGEHGARGRIVSIDDGYGLVVDVRDAANPVTLTATLARAVGMLVLAEGGDEVREEDLGPIAEVCAMALGFGVLLLNGTAVYAKGCGGMKLHRATHLTVDETAAMVALFGRVYGHDMRKVKKHLEVTQLEAFDEACAWVDSNPEIVAQLRDTPELLEAGTFDLLAPKSFLGRLFVKKVDVIAKAAPKKKARSEAEEQRLARAKALVDEALGSS